MTSDRPKDEAERRALDTLKRMIATPPQPKANLTKAVQGKPTKTPGKRQPAPAKSR